MTYQNFDLTSNYVLVSTANSKVVTDIRTLKNCKLSQQIYYSPSSCPIVNRFDFEAGSCFEDYIIPPASFIIGDDLSLEKIKPSVLLPEYTEAVYTDIQETIKQIYKQHTEVTLSYSGGIDSMVLLSFIINLNLLHRTNIIFFKNNVTNAVEKPLVIDLLNKLKFKAKNIEILNITLEDIAHSFNHESFDQLICYSSSSLLRRTKNNAFIFGWHGNQILLHKNTFIDEILLADPAKLEYCKKLISQDKKFYTQSLKKYNFDTHKVGIARQFMLMKPWNKLNGINQNCVYGPIGSDSTFKLLRELDFSKIDPAIIAEASIAKDIIYRNVNDLLAQYYDIEDVTDGDVLLPFTVPLDLLDISKLTIPSTLNHDAKGVEYITSELALAHKNNFIPINTLVVIKALNWISDL
jgi:hypothetical protein